MRIQRDAEGLSLRLEGDGERQLLALCLKRATFEDTPPERQREIVDFAIGLLRALEEPGG